MMMVTFHLLSCRELLDGWLIKMEIIIVFGEREECNERVLLYFEMLLMVHTFVMFVVRVLRLFEDLYLINITARAMLNLLL